MGRPDRFPDYLAEFFPFSFFTWYPAHFLVFFSDNRSYTILTIGMPRLSIDFFNQLLAWSKDFSQ
jgi:hypothetical protein